MSFASLTTNLPNGVTNADSNSSMGTLTQLDPTKLHTYFNDFNLYNAADWVVTSRQLGGGNAIQAIADRDGGFLDLTTDDADGDNTFLQLAKETFKFVSGKQLHFKARFTTINGATFLGNGSFIIGLQIRDTTPLSVSDGVYFSKLVGQLLTFNVVKNSVSSNVAIIGLSPSTTYEVAFIYDGRSEIQYWLDDVLIGELDTTNLPDDEELTISFGHELGGTSVRTMGFDYIYVASER